MCATVDRQIRERLDKIPQSSDKPKNPTVPKKDTQKPTTGHKEFGEQDKTVEGEATPKAPMTCYNCRKPGHIARKCPEPMTSQRKRFLSNVVKELENAESGNDDL
jgi:hypothetical protein